jgi:uncharacterized OB-fold protein
MRNEEAQPSAIRWYYEGLKEGFFRAVRCSGCSKLTFPPTGCCEHCGGWSVEGTEIGGEGTLLFATHNIAPACHPRFEAIAPYVYGHIRLKEGNIVQAIVLGVEATPAKLHELFKRGPVKVKAETLTMQDLPVLAFRLAG